MEELVDVGIAWNKNVNYHVFFLCPQNDHLGIVDLLTTFLHRDNLWPTGPPFKHNIEHKAKCNWVIFWWMLDIGVDCNEGSIALIMLLLENS